MEEAVQAVWRLLQLGHQLLPGADGFSLGVSLSSSLLPLLMTSPGPIKLLTEKIEPEVLRKPPPPALSPPHPVSLWLQFYDL